MAHYNRIAMLVFCAVLVVVATENLVAQEMAPDAGQDFRVVSQIFVDGTATPVTENLTLLSGRLAYDFQLATDGSNEVTEIVIFDQRKRQLILLDIKRELRTDIADFELLKMVENLRTISEFNEDTDFLLNPQFERQVDLKAKTITLSNDHMTYRATGAANSETERLAIYYDTMDQLTRLSASDPARLPPFSRLALNREIRRNGFFPAEVEVSYRAGAVTKDEFNARSTHSPVWQLSNEDRKRIEIAKRYWMQFEKVTLGDYRDLGQQAANGSR